MRLGGGRVQGERPLPAPLWLTRRLVLPSRHNNPALQPRPPAFLVSLVPSPRPPAFLVSLVPSPRPPAFPGSFPHHRHGRLRSFIMLFICPQCDQRCRSLSGLRRHQNSVHQNNPGLSIPVAEIQRIYHPHLNGMYNHPSMLFYFYFSQASAVTRMEHPLHRTRRQKSRPSRQTTIGRRLRPAPALNSQNTCFLTPNFHGERSTNSSNYGPLHSSPTMIHHPSPAIKISTSKSMPLNSATFSGRALVSAMMALSPKRLALRSGRPQSTTFGIGTLAKWSRTSWQLRTSTATLTTQHTGSFAMRNDSIATSCPVIGHGGNRCAPSIQYLL